MLSLGDIALSRRPMAAFVAVGIAWRSFAALVPPVKAHIGASDGLYGDDAHSEPQAHWSRAWPEDRPPAV